MLHQENKLKKFEEIISYSFYDKLLLIQALTHPSVFSGRKDHINSYERLEFLGDSILTFVLSDMLYHFYQDEEEGELAKKRAFLICGERLTEISNEINLGEYLIISDNEDKNLGRTNKRNLENALEAVIGAIYLDGGLDNLRLFINRLWFAKLKGIRETPKNSKVFVQEWSQKKFAILPQYNLIRKDGPDHKPIYHIELILKGFDPVFASGSSLKEAEHNAASSAMKLIESDIKNGRK